MTNHILGIGIDKYTSCNSLDNPVKDLTNIVDVLVGKYEFEKSNINLLTDDKATQENIINALEGLLDTQTVTDNLLILFAGHGDYDDKLELGYLLPVESIPYSKSTYIPYSTIFNYIKAIKSHHILLISDSCFSGSVFNFRSSILTAKDKLDRIPSKWAITSGRIEPVADGKPGHNSPFAFSLLKNLKNNSEPEFGVSELTNRIISDVAGSLPQIPRGEPLQLLGHKGGEFIFRMKPNTKTKTVTAKAIDNSDDLNKLIVSYYEAINKREEAENENKAGTIKRIHQEIFSINNLIQKELIRELEDKKSQLLSKGGLESVLPKQFLVEREELLKIKEEKNTIVRKQKYDEAARLRDIEKALIEKILKGDVSDNIKPCMFNKKWNQDLVPSTTKKASVENGLYIKTNKKTIEYYLSKPEQLDADIRNVSCQGEEYVRGYKENKKLIDFNELPQEYVKDVHEMYSKILT